MAVHSASEILARAEDARATAEATLNGLSLSQLVWSPGGDRWSAAAIVDHLVLSAESAIAAVEPSVREAGTGTPHPYKFTEDLIITSLGPGGKVRLPVPDRFVPSIPSDPRARVVSFFAVHDALVEIAKVALTKDLSRTKIELPAKKGLRIRPIPYLHALFEHERYHLAQVKALIEEPNFPR